MGTLHTVLNAGSHVGGIQSHARIKGHDIARRTGLVAQHLHQHLARGFGCVHPQGAGAGHGQAKVFGVNFVLGDAAVLQLTYQSGRPQAHLVHAVFAMHHEGMNRTQPLERTHLYAHQVGVEHAHQNMGCTGRVG